MSRQPTVLVTGATGLLGANFCALACAHYDVVTGSHRRVLRWPGTRPVALELGNEAETTAVLDAVRPEIIAHFAAVTDVDECEESPETAAKINVAASAALATWAARHGARLLLMSTDAVFDGHRGLYVESDAPRPVNYYAETKLRAEAAAATVKDHLIVRANIFGWNAQAKSNLAEWILGRLQHGDEVPGYANILFNPLLVNTLSGMMLSLLQQEARGLIHLSSAAPISKYDFALKLACEFGCDESRVRRTLRDATAKGARRPLDTTLASLRAKTEFGLEAPTIDEEIWRFKQLIDTGFVPQLRQAVQ